MRNAVIRFCNSPNVIPYLASLGNEVVIRIDHKKCSDLLFICRFCHAPSGLCGHPSRPAGLTEMALPAPLAMRQKCAAGFQSGLCRVGVISRRFLRVHVASGYPPKLTVNADSDSSFEQLATQAVIAARTEGENWIAFGRRVLDAPPAVAVQFGASTLSPSQISSRPRRAGIMSATRKASAGDVSSRSISCSPLCSTMTSVLSISLTPPAWSASRAPHSIRLRPQGETSIWACEQGRRQSHGCEKAVSNLGFAPSSPRSYVPRDVGARRRLQLF